MSALWQALDDDDDDEPARAANAALLDQLADAQALINDLHAQLDEQPRRTSSSPLHAMGRGLGGGVPNPDAPANVTLTEKAIEALHLCPIRAHERQMALVASGNPQAVALHRAVALWHAQRTAAAMFDALEETK